MDSTANIAWHLNNVREAASNELNEVANHQSAYSANLFDGSLALDNLSTAWPPQGLSCVGPPVGNHHQPLINGSQLRNSLGFNCDNSSVGQNEFTELDSSAPNLSLSASSPGPSDTVPQTLNSYYDMTAVIQPVELNVLNGIPSPNIRSKKPLKRPPLRHPLGDSGTNLGGSKKARQSPLRHHTQEKIVKRRKATSGRFRLMEALRHLESIKETLESHNQLLAIVSHLEESIIQHMMTDTRKARTEARWSSEDADSAYHSMSQVSAAEETESLATSSNLQLESQSCSSRAPEEYHQSVDPSEHMDITMDIETPRPTKPTIYHCIFQKHGQTCDFLTPRKSDWVRHGESEEHFPQKRYMCLLCINSLPDEDGNPLCTFCSAPISVTGNDKQHFLHCQKARVGRHIFAGAREEHFKYHLQKRHGLVGIGVEQSTWTFDVQGEWPSECGFCGDRFSSWQVRTNHIADHFREGMEIASWRLPFRKVKAPQDRRPSIDYQKRYDDDDDDDDDGDNHFGGGGRSHTPRALFGSSGSSGSSQPSSSGYDSQGWSDWSVYGGNMFELRTGAYDSKMKVEDYLRHQSMTDRPGENVGCQVADLSSSDTGTELSETPLHNVPTEKHIEVVLRQDQQADVESVINQAAIGAEEAFDTEYTPKPSRTRKRTASEAISLRTPRRLRTTKNISRTTGQLTCKSCDLPLSKTQKHSDAIWQAHTPVSSSAPLRSQGAPAPSLVRTNGSGTSHLNI